MDDTGAIPMRRRVLRALGIAVLVLGAPAAMAAAVTHQMLDGTSWTDHKKAPSVRPPAPTAAPAPGRTASIGPSKLIGRCAIPTQAGAVIAPCATPGALTIVGTVRRDAAGRRPCRTTPFTDLVRRHGAHYLCLGTP